MDIPQRSRTSEEPRRVELEEWNALAQETQGLCLLPLLSCQFFPPLQSRIKTNWDDGVEFYICFLYSLCVCLPLCISPFLLSFCTLMCVNWMPVCHDMQGQRKENRGCWFSPSTLFQMGLCSFVSLCMAG